MSALHILFVWLYVKFSLTGFYIFFVLYIITPAKEVM